MASRTLIVSFLSVALSFSFAAADVTIKSVWHGGGFQGMGANEGSATREVQGSKSREDNQFKFSGKMMKFMTGGDKNGTHIIRVDLDKIWKLDLKKKTYTEKSISAALEKTKEKPKAKEPAPGGTPAPEEKPTHRLKKTEFGVKKTGAKKTVNNFPTEETQARMLVEVEEIATGEVTSYTMLTKFWITPWTADLKKAVDEEMKFQKAYFAKMGLTFSPRDQEKFGGAGLGMMLGLGDKKVSDLLSQLKEKTKDLNGYPIVTDSEWSIQEDPKAVQRKKDAQAKADADTGGSPELSADPQQMAGNLLGAFAKKKMKDHNAAQAKEQEGKPVFSAYHEVQAITVSPVPADLFEIPKGFKKIE